MRNDTVPVENYPLKSIKPAGIRCMGQAAQIGLLGLSLQELTLLVEEAGQPGFRGRQLFEALYRQRVESAEQVSTLPLEFRRALAQSGVSVGLPGIEKRFVSSDGTVRYLMNFVDGQSVETVWMPEGDGGESGDGSEAERGWDRATICISSQVGCAVDCQFCLTALLGMKRKWNLEKLMAAACDFPLRNRERLTFEYVLLDEVNDSAQNARDVVELIRGMRAKVNLIALNPGPGIAFQTPSEQRVLAFQNILVAAGIPAFIRRPRGRDIFAACGQLKRTSEMTG